MKSEKGFMETKKELLQPFLNILWFDRRFLPGKNQHGGYIMLVLSRNTDEKIHIGDNIVITVVEVRGDRVRIGIEAPREVAVHRKEIYDAIQESRERELVGMKPR